MLPFHIDESDRFFLGEDKRLVIVVYQSDGRSVQDVTNWTLSWMLKADLDDADVDASVTKSTAAGTISLTTPSVGEVTVSIFDTDTDSLSPGRYYHELKRTDPGEEAVLCQGRCVLRRGVHRS